MLFERRGPRWWPASRCPRAEFRRRPSASLVEGMAASTTRELDGNMSPQPRMAPGAYQRPTAHLPQGAALAPGALPAAGASNPIHPASLLAREGLSRLPFLTPIPHATPTSCSIVRAAQVAAAQVKLLRSPQVRASMQVLRPQSLPPFSRRASPSHAFYSSRPHLIPKKARVLNGTPFRLPAPLRRSKSRQWRVWAGTPHPRGSGLNDRRAAHRRTGCMASAPPAAHEVQVSRWLQDSADSVAWSAHGMPESSREISRPGL